MTFLISAAGNTAAMGALVLSVDEPDPNAVGWWNPATANEADEVASLTRLLGLDLSAGNKQIFGAYTFKSAWDSGDAFAEYGGPMTWTVAEALKTESRPVSDLAGYSYVPSGSQFVIGKYANRKGGSFVWYLGGEDAYIPWSAAPLWKGLGSDALSHYTTVAVPEPATIFGAGLLFLPLSLSVIRALRTRNA